MARPRHVRLPSNEEGGQVGDSRWMIANSRIGLDHVGWLVWLFLGWTCWLPQPERTILEPLKCAECGCAMQIVRVLHTNCRVLVEHSRAYLDSG